MQGMILRIDEVEVSKGVDVVTVVQGSLPGLYNPFGRHWSLTRTMVKMKVNGSDNMLIKTRWEYDVLKPGTRRGTCCTQWGTMKPFWKFDMKRTLCHQHALVIVTPSR